MRARGRARAERVAAARRRASLLLASIAAASRQQLSFKSRGRRSIVTGCGRTEEKVFLQCALTFAVVMWPQRKNERSEGVSREVVIELNHSSYII